jgi:YidC/Oxa1 family membrane protein insertase
VATTRFPEGWFEVEQRRLLLAVGLSLLLLTLYQEFVVKPYRKDAPTPPPRAAVGEAPAAVVQVPGGLVGLDAAAGPEGGVVVETDTLRATITPVGARLLDLSLKRYPRTVDPTSGPLDLVELRTVLPLTLQIGDETSDAGLVYSADRTELVVRGAEEDGVTFRVDTPEGGHIEKRFSFKGEGYLFGLSTTISGGTPPRSVGLILSAMPIDSHTKTGGEKAIVFANRHLLEKPVEGLQGEIQPVKDAMWAGFAAQYFLTAAVPTMGTVPVTLTHGSGVPVVKLDAPLVDGRATFSIYGGPKDRELLTAAGHDLDRAVDFGWFWFIAIPLLRALRALHGITGNYGVAIILLTTLVKLATVPLTQTTFRNMREMQKIQPQIAKLRERFKEDQTELQKEMMELYRRHRVNPLSGCLPMVLQLPIFVGLYNSLLHAIELRHAPFALWITDLSAPDKLMVGGVGIPVLTILMGGSMFLQQRLSPQQGDPTQQRMMMFMPLVFTFMFLNFPAGLVLYWLVNNLLSIGQQYLLLRSSN